METCFNYCEPHKGFFSSDERKWIARIEKLIEEYPDEIRVIAKPETNDGCIYVQLPAEWLKIQPKRKVEMSEEQKDVLRERLAKLRQVSSETQGNSGENE